MIQSEPQAGPNACDTHVDKLIIRVNGVAPASITASAAPS